MAKTALVTGANGFIGSNLVRALIERGYDVRSMVLRGSPEHFLDGVPAEIVYANITDPDSLRPALNGADIVFHLAALASDWGDWGIFRSLNYEGVLNMLDAAERAGAGRFVHISSLAVHEYRPTFEADENTPADSTLNNYCITKRMGEEAARFFGATNRLDVAIVRPGVMPFGPRDTTSFAPLAGALEKGLFQFINGGRARISVAYVENLCDGIIAAGEKREAAGQTFIICDDEPRSWREIIGAFCRELGANPPRLSLPAAALYPPAALMMALWKAFPLPGQPPLTFYRIRVASQDLYFSNKKTRDMLNWKPRVDFDEGVRRTVEWYKAWQKGHKG